MQKIKVRIVRPDWRSATAFGYVKGRILEVSPEVAAPWFKTGFAEPVLTREVVPVQEPSAPIVARRRGR